MSRRDPHLGDDVDGRGLRRGFGTRARTSAAFWASAGCVSQRLLTRNNAAAVASVPLIPNTRNRLFILSLLCTEVWPAR